MSNKISHSGIIKSIEDNCIKVQIVQTSACAACKVASHCNAAESKVKIVDVFTNAIGYQVGQEVTVWASKDVANRALLEKRRISFKSWTLSSVLSCNPMMAAAIKSTPLIILYVINYIT